MTPAVYLEHLGMPLPFRVAKRREPANMCTALDHHPWTRTIFIARFLVWGFLGGLKNNFKRLLRSIIFIGSRTHGPQMYPTPAAPPSKHQTHPARTHSTTALAAAAVASSALAREISSSLELKTKEEKGRNESRAEMGYSVRGYPMSESRSAATVV